MLRLLKESIRRSIPFRPARYLEHLYSVGMDAVDVLTGPGFGPLPPRQVVPSAYWFRRNGAEYRRHLLEIGGLRRDDRVLDVGCWYGRIAVPLAHVLSPRGRLDGLDVDLPAIAWCRAELSTRYPNCHFEWMDVRNPSWNSKGAISPARADYPYEDASFDFVCGIALVEGLPPEVIDRTLSEMARVLRPGGRCFTTWYLLNEESRRLLQEGRTRPVFAPRSSDLLDPRDPSPKRIYACEERFALSLFAKYGLRIRGPVHYGTWCGRRSGAAYKDLVVAGR